MNGFFNCAIEVFLRNNFGALLWMQVAQQAKLDFERFEPLGQYDLGVTEQVIHAAAVVLERPREIILEDLGNWLVSSAEMVSVRRLLRFGGVTFLDFMHSLEELPARAKLALPDIFVPELRIVDKGEGHFTLYIAKSIDGVAAMFIGLLRAMADEYGALVVLDVAESDEYQESIAVQLLDVAYAQGRRFVLATGGV